MTRRIVRIVFGIVAGWVIAGHAGAQDCVGFTDVPAASAFCPNVEWMKNRGITIGCTSTTLYCPTDVVTRLSMAVFMNRLGKALTPQVSFGEFANGALVVIPPAVSPPLQLCYSSPPGGVGYPRSATIQGVIAGLADANAVSWRGGIATSLDGVTWTPLPNSEFRASSAGNAWSFAAPTATVPVPVGNPLYVALTVARDDVIAGTTGNFTHTRCQIMVEVDNQNGTSSPYDVVAGDKP